MVLTMYFEWTETNEDGQKNYALTAEGSDDETIKLVIAATIEKAVEFLHININDDSLFFLCEWHEEKNLLRIVVSDQQKQQDSEYCVQCQFENLPQANNAERFKLLIRDYLTTCSGFMHYSLVAMFHTGDRNACELL